MKLTVLSIFLLCFLTSFGQEKLSLTYKFGSWKVPNQQLKEFNSFLKKYKGQELDSIIFVGSSDSAGTFLSNFRMTEWRARNLKKGAMNLLPDGTFYRILPCENKGKGEIRDIRQVDIVVYPKKETKIEKTGPEDFSNQDVCYKVAYAALQSCHVHVFSKGSKEYVELEKYFPFSKKDDEVLYYGTLDEAGNFVPKLVKWKKAKTGSHHNQAERWVAQIPEKDFDRFKIFTISKSPCGNCHEDFENNPNIQSDSSVQLPDFVLMENIEFLQPWLLKNKVKVRIPKEFVDLDRVYVSGRAKVEWKAGENSDYYYAKVAQANGNVDVIYRPYRQHSIEACAEEKPYVFNSPTLQCAPNTPRHEVITFAELGYHLQNQSRLPYAAIGVFAGSSRIELEFLAGVHWKSALYGAIRARYTIFQAPFSAFLPKNKWQHSLGRNRFWYAKTYFGAEYKASIGRHTTNYLEPNLYIGLSIAQNGNPTFQRFFIQYGRGLNFLLESPRRPYSLFQLGIQVHLGKKEYLLEKGHL